MPILTQSGLVISYSCHRQYVFKYDRSGRGPQLGVIGEEVQALLPQAVDIVATRSFPNPEKGQPPIVVRRVKGPVPADSPYSRPHRAANGPFRISQVKDLAVVDKNVLFMTNIGAVQVRLQCCSNIPAEAQSVAQQ
jgi:hypothetical protein